VMVIELYIRGTNHSYISKKEVSKIS